MRGAIATLGLLMILAIPAGVSAQGEPVACLSLDPYPAGGCFVAIRDSGYIPVPAQVPVGTTVTWRNVGQQPHTVEDYYGYSFSSGTIQVGGTFSVTFNEPGAFTYNCAIHPEMRGEVFVLG